MTRVRKNVRFFDTIAIDDNDVRGPVEQGFWAELLTAMTLWGHQDREFPVSGVKYFGQSQHPRQPAMPHLQVGRVRDLSEHLELYNLGDGSTVPLEFDDPNHRVAEPTYVVPFGLQNRVAIMSPAVRATRSETLGRWLTGVCGLIPQGRSLEFVPIVDPAVVRKIADARGAVMLEVHVDAEAEIPASGGGQLGNSFRNAKQQTTDELDLTIRWSLGHSTGTESVREAIQGAALWVANGGFSSSAEVKILRENEDGGIDREIHNIFNDRIAKTVEFFVPEGERVTDSVILEAVAKAIDEFRNDGL